MMSNRRFQPSCVLAIALTIVACGAPPGGTPSLEADGGTDRSIPRDAHAADAHVADARMVSDAGLDDAAVGSDAGSDPVIPGSVSCYSEATPNATCSLPTHCCFSNYSSQHPGSCETSSCTWGTIDCDGPEDCATGLHCCAHVIIDPENGITGHKLACQASACGAAPANRELCHPASSVAATCPSGTACVSAADHDFDLPRTLHICQ